jgi:hypothetical protein
MGFTPEQVGRMSLWQFFACGDGWARANVPEAGSRSNDDADYSEIEAILDAAPDFIS